MNFRMLVLKVASLALLTLSEGAMAMEMPDKEALNRKLLMAAENNKTEEIIELLKQGVDVNYHSYGQTPLHRACWNNNLEIAKLLIESNADINLADKNGWTSLYAACWNNSKDMAKLLIEHKADINLADNDGWTPLHVACWNNSKDAAKLLIENKADIGCKNKNGKTALDTANEDGYSEIAEIIEQEQERRKFMEEKRALQERRLLGYLQSNSIENGLERVLLLSRK